jgi:hypothetical protein
MVMGGTFGLRPEGFAYEQCKKEKRYGIEHIVKWFEYTMTIVRFTRFGDELKFEVFDANTMEKIYEE